MKLEQILVNTIYMQSVITMAAQQHATSENNSDYSEEVGEAITNLTALTQTIANLEMLGVVDQRSLELSARQIDLMQQEAQEKPTN